ncbi:MAG: hypothetical protein NC907_05440, partial [Candidatus Omnitrophica bacterium]|nr:hypothetical protein [Candidatus Omnitrophota bacterium]
MKSSHTENKLKIYINSFIVLNHNGQNGTRKRQNTIKAKKESWANEKSNFLLNPIMHTASAQKNAKFETKLNVG